MVAKNSILLKKLLAKWRFQIHHLQNVSETTKRIENFFDARCRCINNCFFDNRQKYQRKFQNWNFLVPKMQTFLKKYCCLFFFCFPLQKSPQYWKNALLSQNICKKWIWNLHISNNFFSKKILPFFGTTQIPLCEIFSNSTMNKPDKVLCRKYFPKNNLHKILVDQNITFSKILNSKILFEIWIGNDGVCSHLQNISRIFQVRMQEFLLNPKVFGMHKSGKGWI